MQCCAKKILGFRILDLQKNSLTLLREGSDDLKKKIPVLYLLKNLEFLKRMKLPGFRQNVDFPIYGNSRKSL